MSQALEIGKELIAIPNNLEIDGFYLSL